MSNVSCSMLMVNDSVQVPIFSAWSIRVCWDERPTEVSTPTKPRTGNAVIIEQDDERGVSLLGFAGMLWENRDRQALPMKNL